MLKPSPSWLILPRSGYGATRLAEEIALMRRDQFLRLVHRAVQSIPAEFHRYLENVEFLIQGEPSSATLERLGLGPDDTLFGLYEGVPEPVGSIGSQHEPELQGAEPTGERDAPIPILRRPFVGSGFEVGGRQ